MNLRLEIGGKEYGLELANPTDISIPVDFKGAQPNSYDVPPATAEPYSIDGWTGDTRQGGSCNFDTVTITPHCNGTHTECVGHITNERISIIDTLRDILIPATLITVQPVHGLSSGEAYDPPFEDGDQVITREVLQSCLKTRHDAFLDALVIRTLPNDDSKLIRRYSQHPAPFFTREAIEFINNLSVQHLLVDFPSLDRAHDEGLMTAHHLYWNIPERSHFVDPESRSLKTVTEFIYVPKEVNDANCLLNLQIAPFKLDAAPSRPVLIPLFLRGTK